MINESPEIQIFRPITRILHLQTLVLQIEAFVITTPYIMAMNNFIFNFTKSVNNSGSCLFRNVYLNNPFERYL